MKYVISENQMAVILAKVAAENSDESIAKVILNSIKKGQARIVDYRKFDNMNYREIIFTIGGLKIEMAKIVNGDPEHFYSIDYRIVIPFFGNKEIEVSDVLGEIIYELLIDQVK